MEAFILPSLTPGFDALDEEGVRIDVRHSIRQGFGAIYAAALGLSLPEGRRFVEIVADEARGKVIVGGMGGGASLQEAIASLKHAESAGVSEVFLPFDPRLGSEEAIYEISKSLITATNLGIVLYASPNPAFLKFHPSGLPMKALDRLVDLPNVIAVKLTQEINLTTAFQIAEMVGKRALIGVVNLEVAPLFARSYPIQWSGEWAVDAVQSPEKPYAVEFMDLLSRRRFSDATKVYWEMKPALDAFFKLQGPIVAVGGHPWIHIKYYKWLTGGNGGLLRDLKQRPDQLPTLDAQGRLACREALSSVGIKCVDLPDEAFVVGNAAYARGARMKDLASTPFYVA
jgi:4-hydroxy-tetrahydrodipicolinate synthase